MLFVVFTEEEMKVSLTIRSKPFSASRQLQLSPHRFKCSHVPLFAMYPCRAERADEAEV